MAFARGSVPYNDEVRYRDWKRREQWKNRGSQYVIDRAILRGACTDSAGCACPICSQWGQMRERAHSNHYLSKMDWPEAWRRAGWEGDGGAETPFCNPGETIDGKPAKVIVTSNPYEHNTWVSRRFAEIDCLPSSDESSCASSPDVAVVKA